MNYNLEVLFLPQKIQNQTAVSSLYHRTNIFMNSLITRIKQTNQLTLWLMKPRCSMPHSQGLLIIPILSRITQFLVFIPICLRYILILPSYLHLILLKGLFPVGLPVKILKIFLPYSILTK
jgi:hypothetical protein